MGTEIVPCFLQSSIMKVKQSAARSLSAKKSFPIVVVGASAGGFNAISDIDDTRQLGTQSLFTCPDCGGTLFHITDGSLSRFRCFTGHAYTEKELLNDQNENIQVTLWVALRMLEEKKKLLGKIKDPLNHYSKKIKEIEVHISRLKDLLIDLDKITSQN